MSDYNPSTADIKKAAIYSYGGRETDISKFIVSFEFSQSMNMTSYRASVTLYETVGLLENFPLRAEESIALEVQSNDMGTVVRLFGKIHRIDNIKPSESNNGVMYTLHFISNTSFEASKRIITKAYTDSVGKIAKQIFQTYFSNLGAENTKDVNGNSLVLKTKRHELKADDNRNFYYQPANSTINAIIPRYNPFRAMGHIASQAYGQEGTSHSFKFFETFENYYFATDDYFIKQHTENPNTIRKFFFAPIASAAPNNPITQLNRLDTFSIDNKGSNSIEDMHNGAYKNKIIELDLVRRKVNMYNFDYTKDAKYIDMSGNPRNLDDVPYTKEFMKDTFTDENARRFLTFKDYQDDSSKPVTSVNPPRFLPQIISNRVSYYHHLNNTRATATTKGRLDLRPGMIIDIDIKNLDSTSKLKQGNASLSGNYLIRSVKHNRGTDSVLNTTLELVKFDWSKG